MTFRCTNTRSTKHVGFTLTEMIVVIGIIVLLVALAVPAFNVISGNRSIDAAQNQLQAIIGRARQNAIGLQQMYGVLMFQDPNTGRACVEMVNFPDPVNPQLLAIAPNQDEVLLPPGVSFRMVENFGGSSGPSSTNQLYSSMNCILFNSRGEFTSAPWEILNSPLTTSTTSPTLDPLSVALGARILNSAGQLPPTAATPQGPGLKSGVQLTATSNTGATSSVTASVWFDPNGTPSNNTPGPSAFGFVLFPDEGAYQDYYSNAANSLNPNQYLLDNGITFLINRYNGTLLRSE